ncbi:PF08818 domain protein [Leptospira inadai serovar Lyme str. 10]|uniref:PF08818 domain protein n=2 Tax=Leptospira inadai serovar Lyme TaxID=293084 RepID=V6HCH4_9LEPT|nr:DUF1801 domain-containing protein [Leptospira inadai]EQA37591.1 PF08818 domain protein [Leptospira inadai serovar Lyme str. 10]PNV74665.1 DUF1801 domain-containing protein [Leptospira inadai serovar Lyme]
MKSKKINTDSKKKIEFGTAAVAEVFYNYPERMRTKLLFLRQLIFDTASMTESIGPLEETLKWGEPSYLTTQTKSGSTIRIHHRESRADEYGIYFNCKTTLIEQFKRKYRNQFRFEGNRSIVFKYDEPIPVTELQDCISLALTYHRSKSNR